MIWRFLILLSGFIFLNFLPVQCQEITQDIDFDVCPLCTNYGELTCPSGYKVICADKVRGETEPKCLFLESRFIPGCWKHAGKKSIDFSILPGNMPPSTMIKITGGGDVYVLNREIIGCKKL